MRHSQAFSHVLQLMESTTPDAEPKAKKLKMATSEDHGYNINTRTELDAEAESIYQVERLTFLPSEILQNIISYLFESHDPQKIREGSRKPPKDQISKPRHPNFSRLLLVSKKLKHELHVFCKHFLLEHESIVNKRAIRHLQAYQSRPIAGLVVWINKYCVWCGKKCRRDAILMNGMRTCTVCDRRQWPEKITLREAQKQYGVKEEHLQLETNSTGGQNPPIRWARYWKLSATRVLVLRHEVAKLSSLIYKDNIPRLLAHEKTRSTLGISEPMNAVQWHRPSVP